MRFCSIWEQISGPGAGGAGAAPMGSGDEGLVVYFNLVEVIERCCQNLTEHKSKEAKLCKYNFNFKNVFTYSCGSVCLSIFLCLPLCAC